jgi:hypothetical protein
MEEAAMAHQSLTSHAATDQAGTTDVRTSFRDDCLEVAAHMILGGVAALVLIAACAVLA